MTRSCWRRVEDLEDEEAALNHRLMKLEKLRRRERLEILGMEQVCQAAEVAMLQAQEQAADCDARASLLESLAQDAADDADDAEDTAPDGQRAAESDGAHHTPQRRTGAAALELSLRELPVHEEKCKQLLSVLQQTENELRSQIAEAARAAAELRRSAKKLDGERLPLEHETSALRSELKEMAGEDEIRARMARAKQIGDGLQRRLQHATNKLASVRDSITQGAAKRLEGEEQQSLELMQAITQVKGHLPSQEGDSDQPRARAPSSSTNRGSGGGGGGRGRVFSPPRHSQQRLQLQYSRSVGRSSHQSASRSTSGGGWS
eukprot:g8989.t2